MKRLKLIIIAVILFLVPLTYAHRENETEVTAQALEPQALTIKLGDPLPGLDSEEFARFLSGKREFERPHNSMVDGLGPTFNHVSCAACHDLPTTGGSLRFQRDIVVRIGRRNARGEFDALAEFGGDVLSRQTLSNFPFVAANDIPPGCVQPGNFIPEAAQFISFRSGQQLFGLGLIDAIDERTILANEDPFDRDGDGISGRANIVTSFHFRDKRLGRFGWKGQMASLFDFCGDAYLVENGITNPDFPLERRPNGVQGGAANCDPIPGIEDVGGRVVNSFVDFITLLAPPQPKPLDASATRGRQLFTDIGCAKCHIPSMMTSPNPLQPEAELATLVASRRADLYSDLLLHDMGDDLADGITQEMCTGREWRTQPLWGISSKIFFLHDGRAKDMRTAILYHGGEAANARERFLKLKESARQDLINFLKSL